jgi:3-phenylpropionate/trans-cinnamate dioxygenase ferredoxin reductase subunit
VFAIVGASLAGLRAAESLRALGFDGVIRLIGDEPHAPYERPPLSKTVLQGTAGAESLVLRHDWAEIDVELVTGDAVVDIDAAGRQLTLASGAQFRADKVLLATGGRPARLPVPGSGLDGVFTLRDLDEALMLAARLSAGAHVVVVGAGFIGLEVAASAQQLGCEVTIVEAASVPLSRGLGPEWGAFVAEHHMVRGVRIGIGIGVRAVRGEGGRVVAVDLEDGTSLAADVVVVGIGMCPRVELAERLGLRVDGGIVVDAAARTSRPDVFAAGDVTVQPSWDGTRLVRYESYQNAQGQAAVAAASMLGLTAAPREVPWFWSDQFDLNIQTAGELGGPDEVVLRGDRDGLSFAAFHLQDERVVGVFAINRGRDVRAGMTLIERRLRITTDVLTDESIDLRKFTRRGAVRATSA